MFGKKGKEKEAIEEVAVNQPEAPKDESLISLEEVQQVLQGDKEALEQQMERAKKLLSQTDIDNYKTKIKSNEIKLNKSMTVEGREKIEAEERAKAEYLALKEKEAKEAELRRLRDEANAKIQLEEALKAQNKAKLEAEEKIRMAALGKKQKEADELKKQQELEKQRKIQEQIKKDKEKVELKRQQELANKLKEQERIKKLEQQAKLKEQERIRRIDEQKKLKEQKKLAKKANRRVTNTVPVKKEKVKKNNTNSNAKYIIATILVICLALFVIFLPEIRTLSNKIIADMKSKDISTGKLICSIEKYSDNLDANYSYSFAFKENKLDSLTYIKTIRGDETLDVEDLNEVHDTCKLLRNDVATINGIEVNCSLNEGKAIEKQIFTYDILDLSQLKSSYAEYGGVLPNYKYQDDIKSIENEMVEAEYECEKVS